MSHYYKESDDKILDFKAERRMRSQSRITPEMAANVVRDFILPMFDNDGKKLLKMKKKRDKL